MPYDEIAADLPPPGDDEPASLRQDLLAELADHLACAMARETQLEQVVRQDPGSTAWGRVVARFGDPRAVMFRLWREAMWERLMMQRVVSWMMIVTMGALCLGMVFVVRSVNQQQLAMAQQQQAMALQQQEIAATLQRISEQSAREAASNASAASIEWVPVEVSLSGVDPQKALPPGFRIRLSLQQPNSSMPPWEAKTDKSSRVRFPLVHYGRYLMTVDSPWGERTAQDVNVNPATPVHLSVVCPGSPLEPLTVMPELVLPDDLKQKSLQILIRVGEGQRRFGEWTWQTNASSARILVGADGQIRPFYSPDAETLAQLLVYGNEGNLTGIRWPEATLLPSPSLQFHILVKSEVAEHGRLFEFREPFEIGREIRFDPSAASGKLLVEPTVEGLPKLRELLNRFDVMMAKGANGIADVVIPYGSDVPLPPIPTERP